MGFRSLSRACWSSRTEYQIKYLMINKIWIFFFSWYMTVLAWDYFLVYQIKDIRSGKTSSRLWKVLAFLSVKYQKEGQKSGVIYRTGWQEMLRAREQDSCGICVHIHFPSYEKKGPCLFLIHKTAFFFNSYWLTCGIYMSLTAITWIVLLSGPLRDEGYGCVMG